jgi:hypothetical protein
MSGGGKGGATTSSVSIPEYLEAPARSNIAKAEEISRIGYVPYYGPDVAAMTPAEMAAGQNINQAALAFGLAAPETPMAGMPTTTLSYGGVPAYSSGGIYDESLAELERRRPGQYAALNAPFIDPVTGMQPRGPYGSGESLPGQTGYMTQAEIDAVLRPAQPSVPLSYGSQYSRGDSDNIQNYTPPSGGINMDGSFGQGIRNFGYDLIDGGGLGASGDRFVGGPISMIGNLVTSPRERTSDGGLGGKR